MCFLNSLSGFKYELVFNYLEFLLIWKELENHLSGYRHKKGKVDNLKMK